MNTPSVIALRKLGDSLPHCDTLNLGYALIIQGELPSAIMEQAVRDVVSADPLLKECWSWGAGECRQDEFAARAAAHLATPLEPNCPFRAALWSEEGTTHLFLLAVHHTVADGVVLDRIGADLSRSLQGKPPVPRLFAEQRSLPPLRQFTATRLPLAPSAPSLRASCRMKCIPADLTQRFHETMRSWRATPFAGVVTCAAAVLGAWTGETAVSLAIQVASRNSMEALRAPGPWYDHSRICVTLTRDEPLRSLLLQVSQALLQVLTTSGMWAAGDEEHSCPELLVVYDQHPLSRLRIPGCLVLPQAVQRHTRRSDGVLEYLVATEPDIVLFYREQGGMIGLSLFSKKLRVPEATAEWLFQATLETLSALCEEDHDLLELAEPPVLGCIETMAPALWPEPALSDLPMVDAVSPVFRVCRDTLASFGRDARQTLAEWGTPPWL
jgi:hypothetical protein